MSEITVTWAEQRALVDRIKVEASYAARPGQMDRLLAIAEDTWRAITRLRASEARLAAAIRDAIHSLVLVETHGDAVEIADELSTALAERSAK